MLKEKKLFLLDIDGTISLGNKIIDGTFEFLDYLNKKGLKYIFITNNSTRSIDDYVKSFRKSGFSVYSSNFITSSYATANYLKEKYLNERIFVLGTKSFMSELEKFNLNITSKYEKDIKCAVVGYDNELTYKKIEDISRLLIENKNIEYIATNPDLVCPVSFGYVPDCGALCEMIEHAVKRTPVYIGKPNSTIIDICLEKSGINREETLIIGDRLYTDIACGINANVETCLVFTGEASKSDLETTKFKPTYSFDSIRDIYRNLLQNYFK